MPTLNSYANSTDKKGVYINAHVGDGSIITLQVSGLAERLLNYLGYHPSNTVPSKLVWSMYNVGLLYTFNSLEDARNTGRESNIIDKLDSGNTLSEKRKEEIISELKTYKGPNSPEVSALIERLGSTKNISNPVPQPEKESDFALLEQWTNSERLAALRQSIDGFEEYATASIKTFAKHPYLSAPPVWLEDDGGVKYYLKKDSQNVYIYDHRYKPDYDYLLILERSDNRRELARLSKTGNIVDYQNEAGRIGSRINMEPLTEWAVPDENILVEIPPTSERSDNILNYDGRKIEPTPGHELRNSSDLMFVEVDRISKSSNPVVELNDGCLILNQGEPGDELLVERTSNQKARVISRVISELPGEVSTS